jgi:hypothetical protein
MHSAPRSATTRALIGVLAFALWATAMLGVMHRALHAPGHPAVGAWVADNGQAPHAGKASHSGRGLFALFGPHSDAECDAYDQLSSAPAALGVPLLIVPAAPPSAAVLARREGAALARWVALFDARGPPAFR